MLPWVIAVALLIAPAADTAAGGIALFALAGLACSGFFPMTIGYGESSFPGMVELAAGWLIAAYQIGYGLAAFGGGALQDAVSLPTLFRCHRGPRRGHGRAVAPHRPCRPPAERTTRRDHPIWTMTHRRRSPVPSNTSSRQLEERVMPDRYDVIVIGTGAGGGTLAHTLAASGKRILLLERGNFLPRETQNWEPEPVFVDGRYISPDTWYDADGTPFQPQVHYFVGGATKLYGAALYRLRPQDFGEIKHADGISPAWPVSYDDFEPWYTKAEWLYQVHGNHGDDPTEGHWSQAVPVAGRLPRTAHPGDRPTTWRPPATTRSPRRAASCSTRPTGPAARASAARGATAIRAWCTPSPTPRRSPCGRC